MTLIMQLAIDVKAVTLIKAVNLLIFCTRTTCLLCLLDIEVFDLSFVR